MALFVEQPHLLAHLEDLETLFFKCDVTAPFMAILDAVLASNCKLRTIKLWFKRDACVDSLVSLLGHPALKDIKQWELLPAQPSYSWFNRCGELKASKFIEACEERGIEVGWTKNVSRVMPDSVVLSTSLPLRPPRCSA